MVAESLILAPIFWPGQCLSKEKKNGLVVVVAGSIKRFRFNMESSMIILATAAAPT